MEELAQPRIRSSWIGDPALTTMLRQKIAAGTFSHGWLLTGMSGVGKATLAYQIAKALLSNYDYKDETTLSIRQENKSASLVSANAHPDLFVAERRWDEKKGKIETEIPVDVIRKLTTFMHRTASMSKWRVAIVDKADDLNQNSANALLKLLEEPPKNCLILLVTDTAGGLLPTITSRCRRISLKPVEQSLIKNLIATEINIPSDEAANIAKAANGRPGFALSLAAGEGAEAIEIVNDFLRLATSAKNEPSRIVQALTGKATEDRWQLFQTLVLDRICDAARAQTYGIVLDDFKTNASANDLSNLWRDQIAFLRKGNSVNLDRSQMINSLFRSIREVC